jgi:hypothetical protein
MKFTLVADGTITEPDPKGPDLHLCAGKASKVVILDADASCRSSTLTDHAGTLITVNDTKLFCKILQSASGACRDATLGVGKRVGRPHLSVMPFRIAILRALIPGSRSRQHALSGQQRFVAEDRPADPALF